MALILERTDEVESKFCSGFPPSLSLFLTTRQDLLYRLGYDELIGDRGEALVPHLDPQRQLTHLCICGINPLPHLLEATSLLFPELISSIPSVSLSPVAVSLSTSTPQSGDLLLTVVSSSNLSRWLNANGAEMKVNRVCLMVDLTTSASQEEYIQFLSSAQEVLQELDMLDGAVVICLPSSPSTPEELSLISNLKSKALELKITWTSSLAAFASSTLPPAPFLSPPMTVIKRPYSLFRSSSLLNYSVLATVLIGCAMTVVLQRRGTLRINIQQILDLLARWSTKFRKLYSF